MFSLKKKRNKKENVHIILYVSDTLTHATTMTVPRSSGLSLFMPSPYIMPTGSTSIMHCTFPLLPNCEAAYAPIAR
jgi:hypothetical protein